MPQGGGGLIKKNEFQGSFIGDGGNRGDVGLNRAFTKSNYSSVLLELFFRVIAWS